MPFRGRACASPARRSRRRDSHRSRAAAAPSSTSTRLALLQRHVASARTVTDYDINNAYQYIVAREETHVYWVHRALLDVGATVPADAGRADDRRRAACATSPPATPRANHAFVDTWTPRVAAVIARPASQDAAGHPRRDAGAPAPVRAGRRGPDRRDRRAAVGTERARRRARQPLGGVAHAGGKPAGRPCGWPSPWAATLAIAPRTCSWARRGAGRVDRRRARLAVRGDRAGRRPRPATRLPERGRRRPHAARRRARCSTRCSRSKRRAGATRPGCRAARTLDLDLVLYGDERHRRARPERAASAVPRAALRARPAGGAGAALARSASPGRRWPRCGEQRPAPSVLTGSSRAAMRLRAASGRRGRRVRRRGGTGRRCLLRTACTSPARRPA